MALADVVHEEQVPSSLEYSSNNFKALSDQLDVLTETCNSKLLAQVHTNYSICWCQTAEFFNLFTFQGFEKSQISFQPFLHLRYDGTDCALMCSPHSNTENVVGNYGDFITTFLERYRFSELIITISI